MTAWRMYARQEPSLYAWTLEWEEEQRVLSAVGYGGMFSFETKEASREAAIGLRDRLGAHSPHCGWTVVCFSETRTDANAVFLGDVFSVDWAGVDDDGAGGS